MHQSGVRGSRPLAAGSRLRRRTLQQLQRSASQCSAADQPTPADASPLAGKLPSAGPLARTTALTAASDPQGRSSRSRRDEPSPHRQFPAGVAQDSPCGVLRYMKLKTHRLKPVLPEPEMGKRPGRGSGRSWGMGKFKKLVSLSSRSYRTRSVGTGQTQEDQHSKHRDADCGNHRSPRSF